MNKYFIERRSKNDFGFCFFRVKIKKIKNKIVDIRRQIEKSEKMDKNFVADWLNKLKEYWFQKEVEKAVSLFQKTTFYQETPFMEPYTTLEEIREEWQHVKNENIQNIEIKPLAIEGYIVIAQWILKQNNQNFDGIYEIKFNENLECIYFKSWEMKDE